MHGNREEELNGERRDSQNHEYREARNMAYMLSFDQIPAPPLKAHDT